MRKSKRGPRPDFIVNFPCDPVEWREKEIIVRALSRSGRVVDCAVPRHVSRVILDGGRFRLSLPLWLARKFGLVDANPVEQKHNVPQGTSWISP